MCPRPIDLSPQHPHPSHAPPAVARPLPGAALCWSPIIPPTPAQHSIPQKPSVRGEREGTLRRQLDSPSALPPDPSAPRSCWPAHAALGGLICSASRPVLAESGAPGGSKPSSLKLLDSRCRRQWQTGGVSICRLSPLRRPSALPLRASDLPASRSGRLAAALRSMQTVRRLAHGRPPPRRALLPPSQGAPTVVPICTSTLPRQGLTGPGLLAAV